MSMSETMEPRGSKRACLTNPGETKDHVVKDWSRLFSRLRVHMHLEQVVKVLISLAIPLMSTLKQVLAVMIRVADPEEMDVIHDLVSSIVQEKKSMEKGKIRKSSKEVQRVPASKASTSVGSFEVISEHSHVSRKDRAASSSKDLQPELPIRMCFCGLTPQLLTCRKEGPNFMRRFYRCPKPYQHQTLQCEYFAWTEDTKAEKLYHQSATLEKPKKSKPTKMKSKVVSETEPTNSDEDDMGLAQSPSSASPKTPVRIPRCQHDWNRRGTNAHVKIKTCNLCGRRETLRYKDNQMTVSYVDVSNQKKSGRVRALSP
eukprot:s367_g34.t1